MLNNYLIFYIVFVGFFGLLIVLWLRKNINRTEYRRKKRITKLKNSESAKTETPFDKPILEAKETAVESIEHRFSIIRKVTLFLIVTVWFIAIIFPFLNNIPATFVSILVASSGIILGIASRPIIENMISGIVISFSHPVRIGDTVIIDDNYGNIEDITITHTIVKIWNWRRYIIPNSRMLSKEIINCTINDSYQWTHVEFYVSYDSDVKKVKAISIQTASKSKYFANYEEPRFWVMGMEEKGYRCWIAAWADSPVDAWELGNEIRTELIQRFNSNGIKTHKIETHVDIAQGKPPLNTISKGLS
jgi:small-conductance mechanosensitive channel